MTSTPTGTMNIPPIDGIRVPPEDLEQLEAAILKKVPIPDEHAELIARLLVETDLRGVVSHGARLLELFVRSFQDGVYNPYPNVQVLGEGPCTAALSGDGGIGIVVGARAMQMCIQKARTIGVGVATTVYHDHLGSTGKYVRMALRENMIGISMGGRSAALEYDRDNTLQGTIQGSPPVSFGMPSGPDHPPFLLDMATHMPWDEQTFSKMPQVYFKGIGIAHVGNILSGTLSGMMLPEFQKENTKYDARAGESGFFMALDIERFTPLQAFKGDMDRLVDEVGKMKPFPGYETTELPGGPEWNKEKEYRRTGVPMSAATTRSLETLADEFGLAVPWSRD